MLQQWTSLPYAGQVLHIIIILFKQFDRSLQNPPYYSGKLVLNRGRSIGWGLTISLEHSFPSLLGSCMNLQILPNHYTCDPLTDYLAETTF